MSVELDRLYPLAARGFCRGFGNLFRKENGLWWRTRKWLVQTVIWLVLVNGILAVMLLSSQDERKRRPQRRFRTWP